MDANKMMLQAEYLRALFVVKALEERRWSRTGPVQYRFAHLMLANAWIEASRMTRRMFR